jgi:hypothetical protein
MKQKHLGPWVVDNSGLPNMSTVVSAGDQGHCINSVDPQGRPDYSTSQHGVKRNWGMSSEHSGEVVIVSFADAHTLSVPRSSDARVLYAFVSTNGNESVSESEL